MILGSKEIKILLALGAIILIGVVSYFYLYSSPSASNNVIALRSCNDINPAVATFTSSEPVYLKNNDSSVHTLTFSSGDIAMAAGATMELKSLLNYGSGGTYSFDCDGVRNAGRIQIEGRNETEAAAGVSFKELYDDSMTESQKKCAREAFAPDFDDVYKGLSAMKEEARNKFAACVTAQ